MFWLLVEELVKIKDPEKENQNYKNEMPDKVEEIERENTIDQFKLEPPPSTSFSDEKVGKHNYKVLSLRLNSPTIIY